MAKFIVTCGHVIYGPYDDRRIATAQLIQILAAELKNVGNPDAMNDWSIKETEEDEEQPKDVPDLIPDFSAACNYLEGVGCPPGKDIDVRASAFAKLLTLCKAWNRADRWEEPNWKNSDDKWFPEILINAANKVEVHTDRRMYMPKPFVFKTEERARQFGEKFIDLFKQLYGIGEGE